MKTMILIKKARNHEILISRLFHMERVIIPAFNFSCV